jgi:hypothetical protein
VGRLGVNSNTLIFLQFDYLSGACDRSSLGMSVRCVNANPREFLILAVAYFEGWQRRGFPLGVADGQLRSLMHSSGMACP